MTRRRSATWASALCVGLVLTLNACGGSGEAAATKGDEAIRQTIEQIDAVDRLVKAYPNDLEWARTADDIVRIHKAGKIASMAGVEGGDQTAGNLAVLRQFYRLGARYMTLTHSKTTDWADSATDASKHGGLSPFGVKVVQEMNRLGMLVDLSHVSPAVMSNALDVTAAPVIFSHSSARALVDHPRNVPDSILARLPKNGGVVMVTFVPSFDSKAIREWEKKFEAFKPVNPVDSQDARRQRQEWRKQNPAPQATLQDVADHIDHVRKVAGVDHVGIGSDFDGIDTTPVGLQDVSTFPVLFAELIRRGWSDADLKKLSRGYILRVLRQAEAVAAQLQKTTRPSVRTIEELDGAAKPATP